MNNILQFGPWRVDLSSVEFETVQHERTNLIDVTVFSPIFAQLEHDVRIEISFLVLGWTLGEDDFERWIGDVHETAVRPENRLTAAELAESVDAFATRPLRGEWELLRLTDEGETVGTITRRTRIKWLDYPTRDLHNEISANFDVTDSDALGTLQQRETELIDELGSRGVIVATTTIRGRRTIHAYTDSEDQNVTDLVQRWCARHPEFLLEQTLDATWRGIQHYLG